MNNITPKNNGFDFNELNYLFQDFEIDFTLIPYQIISDTQTLVGTTEGQIFLDLSCTINKVIYTNINDFITELYSVKQ